MGATVTIGLPEIIAAFMMLSLNAYVLTGGADFGGGVWDLLARGPRRQQQRDLISHSIAPIWEANHVWLILVVVILFSAFPPAYATLGTVLHIPLTIMLAGIVFRGSSFIFRSYASDDRTMQQLSGRVFSIASIVTPIILGMIVGALASGAVGRAASVIATRAPAAFTSVYVDPWLAIFPALIGIMTLTVFAFLAAVYLGLAAKDDELREIFRRHALRAQSLLAVLAVAGLVVAKRDAPMMHAGLMHGSAYLLPAGATLAALIATYALLARRWLLARNASAAQITFILWGWTVSQYPWLIPSAHAIRSDAAPEATLRLLLVALIGGAALLFPALYYLFRTFTSDEL